MNQKHHLNQMIHLLLKLLKILKNLRFLKILKNLRFLMSLMNLKFHLNLMNQHYLEHLGHP